MALIGLFSLLAAACLLQALLRRGMALSLFASASGAAVLLSIAGLLRPAALLLFWSGLLTVPLVLLRVRRLPKRERRGLLLSFASPAAVLYAAAALAFRWAYRGAGFYYWDEFSHWGLAVKEMTLTHSLTLPGSLLLYPDYPPGSALFQYLFTANAGFSEPVVYFAWFLLLAAPMTLLLRGWTWRRRRWTALAALAAALFLGVGGARQALLSLYVDPLLGAFFFALVYGTVSGEEPGKDLPLLAPALFLLPLLKKSGIFFALVALAAVLADAALRRARWRRPGSKTLLKLLLLAAAPFAAHACWGGWVSAHGLKTSYVQRPAKYAAALSSEAGGADSAELRGRGDETGPGPAGSAAPLPHAGRFRLRTARRPAPVRVRTLRLVVPHALRHAGLGTPGAARPGDGLRVRAPDAHAVQGGGGPVHRQKHPRDLLRGERLLALPPGARQPQGRPALREVLAFVLAGGLPQRLQEAADVLVPPEVLGPL